MQGADIIKALEWRYAVKTFDATKKVSDENLKTILESGRLAPSSVGLEPWKFIVVNNPEIRTKLRAVGYDQTKFTDASHLIVVARRTDAEHLSDELIARASKITGKTPEQLAGLKGMADGSVNGRPEGAVRDGWLAAQTYIPFTIMMQTAALLGIDAGPMEGFDPTQVNEILGLAAKNLAVVTILAIGYRGTDPYADSPKVRRSYDEVVEVIS